jgi:hypothetical protein
MVRLSEGIYPAAPKVRENHKFVRIDLSIGMFGRKVTADYQEIIHQYAAEGWRLAHILGPGTLPGVPSGAASFELIFERPNGVADAPGRSSPASGSTV